MHGRQSVWTMLKQNSRRNWLRSVVIGAWNSPRYQVGHDRPGKLFSGGAHEMVSISAPPGMSGYATVERTSQLANSTLLAVSMLDIRRGANGNPNDEVTGTQ